MQAFEVKNKEDDFLGSFSGKYTDKMLYKEFGQYNQNNNLHGRVILMNFDGNI